MIALVFLYMVSPPMKNKNIETILLILSKLLGFDYYVNRMFHNTYISLFNCLL